MSKGDYLPLMYMRILYSSLTPQRYVSTRDGSLDPSGAPGGAPTGEAPPGGAPGGAPDVHMRLPLTKYNGDCLPLMYGNSVYFSLSLHDRGKTIRMSA